MFCSGRKYLFKKNLVIVSNLNISFSDLFWKYLTLSLRKKCRYSQLFWSAFSRIQTEYGEILFLPIESKCRKMRTRITPNMDTFHALSKQVLVAWAKHDLLQKYFKYAIKFWSFKLYINNTTAITNKTNLIQVFLHFR